MHEGTFIEELYYVLNRISIQIAPLRSRKEDIPSIVEHLLSEVKPGIRHEYREDYDEALERLKAI